MQTLYIIRGLPGSGKSTLADNLCAEAGTPDHMAFKVEADMFFTSSNGHKEVYKFDRRYLGAAHDECYGRTMRYLRAGYTVAVANTFSTQREVDRYVAGLERTGLSDKIAYKIIKCVGTYKSVHNVPVRAIKKMQDRWEDIAQEIIFNGDMT